MTTVDYELYADEAWTHINPPLNRYWCFFGGVFGETAPLDRLNKELKAIKKSHGMTCEIKWTNLKATNSSCCKEMIDCLFNNIRISNIKYRQMFLDRSLIRIPNPGESPCSDLDIQFKLYYQFIKHAFGLRYLPTIPGRNANILLRLDEHSSLKHMADLTNFVQHLPTYWGRSDLTMQVSFVKSSRNEQLQICDLMMGAAGSHGNKMSLRRANGRRGMTDKQMLRHDLAVYIYEHMRKLDSEERGSRAFNWFESTGLQGDPANHHFHKARIWKFKPSQYKLDMGWENSQLDKYGQYVKSMIVPARGRKMTDEETY
ncbi:MAG TPA: hypothetical protein PLW65_08860 [Pseudomonadota bacterium]|nr:hypothetical protein [Pseudomonadota bacterium]